MPSTMDLPAYEAALARLVASGGSPCAVRQAMNLLIIVHNADLSLLEMQKPLAALMTHSPRRYLLLVPNLLAKRLSQYVRSLAPLPADIGSRTLGELIRVLEHSTVDAPSGEPIAWYAPMLFSRRGATVQFLRAVSRRSPMEIPVLIREAWSDLTEHYEFIEHLLRELAKIVHVPSEFFRPHDVLAIDEDRLYMDTLATALRATGRMVHHGAKASRSRAERQQSGVLGVGVLAMASLDAFIREACSVCS